MGRNIRKLGGVIAGLALAGSLVVGTSSGFANAAPVTGQKHGIQFTRTLDKETVKVGEQVTVTTKLERKSGFNLVAWMRDHHPTCFEYVPGSLSWEVSDGHYNETNRPNEVSIGSDSVTVDPYLANSWQPPIVVRSTYTVDCGPGTIPSGGTSWNIIVGDYNEADFSSAGPNITVEKADSSVSMGTIGSATTGVSKSIHVYTNGVPNGEKVAIFEGGTKVGEATVDDGQALIQWKPETIGSHTLTARYAGSGRVMASQSQPQTFNVSANNEISSTTLAPVAGAKVGAQTPLKAAVAPAAANSSVVFKVNNIVVGEVDVVDGEAAYAWAPAQPGSANVTAEYSGGEGINGSVSEAQTVKVAEADPAITETSTTVNAPATAEVGAAVTLEATVDGGTEGAKVTFKSGTKVIGEGALDANGKASASWTPVVAGPATITAEYVGDDTTAASSGSVTFSVAAQTDSTDPTDPGEPGGGSLQGGSASGENSALGSLGSSGNGTGSLGSLSGSLAG